MPDGLSENSTRQKILGAALTLLSERAGSIASVRAIADRAGVSTGALQHHFPTKQGLIEEVMTIVYDMAIPSHYLEDSSVSPRDRLASCLHQVVSPHGVEASPRQAWQVTYERYLHPDATDDARTEYLTIERELLRRIEHCLTVLQHEGAVPDGDHERTARSLLTTAYGISISRALPHDGHRVITDTDVLRTAIDAVIPDPLTADPQPRRDLHDPNT